MSSLLIHRGGALENAKNKLDCRGPGLIHVDTCKHKRSIAWIVGEFCGCHQHVFVFVVLCHQSLFILTCLQCEKKRKRQTEKRNKRKEAALEGIMGHRLSVDEAPTNSCFASKPFLSSHSSPPWMDPSSFDRTATDRDDATKSRILL